MGDFKSDGKAILIVFIGVIIAATLILNIADTENLITNKLSPTNETVTIDDANTSGVNIFKQYNLTNAPTGAKQSFCPLESISVASGNGTALTNGTDFIVDAAFGNITFLPTLAVNISVVELNNNTVWNYTFCPDGYVNDSGARAITRLITLFAALAILVFAIIVFISTGSLGKFMGKLVGRN